MIAFIVRRLAFGAATVGGVLTFLFMLFFLYATPEDMARRALGDKAPPQAISTWIANHGYDRPLAWNPDAPADTLLVEHFRRSLSFDFGRSDADGMPIYQRIREGVGPSLALTLPLFVLGLLFSVALGLVVATFRDSYIDRAGLVLCVLTMSLSILLYIIGGQWLLGTVLRWFPVSGFDTDPAMLLRFVALPVLVGVFVSFGEQTRFYRTLFVEETSRDYVRTARANGCGDGRVMWRHVLPNALIPIVTHVVVAIPLLFTGSILLESFFGIPGLGSMTVEAIHGNDFATLRAMVFLGSLLFIAAQIATDVLYTLLDPRIRLG